MGRRPLLAFVLVAVAGIAGCGGSDDPPTITALTATPSPTPAMEDDRIIQPPAGTTPDAFVDDRMARMADLGVKVVRVSMLWHLIAPTRPADPANPADPAYDWSRYDPVVAAAQRRGMTVLFSVWSPPDWAADPVVPASSDTAGGGWKQRRPADPAAYGAFARAAATRYRQLTRWEAWNEPNITFYLRPQFEKQGDRWVATGPRTYTALANAFRDNVRAVIPDAQIAGVATAPAGDKCDLGCPFTDREPNRIGPQVFLQGLDAAGLRPALDAVSHHPYPSSPPAPDDTKLVRRLDLYNLADLPAAIDATYLKGAPIWITEYGFQTEKTDVLGYFLPPEQQATAIAEAYATMLAMPRIKLASYYFLQDNGSFQSGLSTVDGTPKPGASAYALPFARAVDGGDDIVLVGQARPAGTATKVVIEWKSGDDWKAAATVDTIADGSFRIGVAAPTGATLRAHWTGPAPSGASGDWISPPVTIDPA